MSKPVETSLSAFAPTPEPPYYAVIFTSTRKPGDHGYQKMAMRMIELASQQPGFLGIESTGHEQIGITVSYWSDLEAIRHWKDNLEHREAQTLGRERWYSGFRIRIARIERDYGM